MTAHVGKAFQLTVRAAHDDGRFFCNLEDLEIARLRQFRLMSSEDPVAIDDALNLEFVDLRVGIETLVERESPASGMQSIRRCSIIREKIMQVPGMAQS